jgi:hypothetical protein
MVMLKQHYVVSLNGTLLITLTFALAGAQPKPPILSSIIPSQGIIGTRVTLVGSGFTAAENTIHFGIGGSRNVASKKNGTIIQYIIPAAVSSCDLVAPTRPPCKAPVVRVNAGSYQISVSNASGQTSELTFIVR